MTVLTLLMRIALSLAISGEQAYEWEVSTFGTGSWYLFSHTEKPIARKVSDKLVANAVATTGSAGVQNAQLSSETQQLSLATRTVAEVTEAEEVIAAVEQDAIAVQKVELDRSTEDIRRTIVANKSSIHSLYNRALRKKASLQGAVTP